MNIRFRMCESEDDLAAASLFLLKRKRDLHPAYSTLAMVELLYSYATQGHVLGAFDDDRMVAVGAYYLGTPDSRFEDREIAWIDVTIVDKAYRGSRLFMRGLHRMAEQIAEAHPDVREIRLAALAEKNGLRGLYAKFMSPLSAREGTHGQEIVFSGKIDNIRGVLKKFSKL